MNLLVYRLCIKKHPALLVGLFIIFICSSLKANTYYISSSNGNDSNNGSSATYPIKTISKPNSIVFQPGDSISLQKFKKGIYLLTIFYGEKSDQIKI